MNGYPGKYFMASIFSIFGNEWIHELGSKELKGTMNIISILWEASYP
jgi:hypothetical protein